MLEGQTHCHYCKEFVPVAKRTKDHVVPRSRGGVDERWNIVLACTTCNHRKSNDWPRCGCNFCRRARRRHWQWYGIHEHSRRRG